MNALRKRLEVMELSACKVYGSLMATGNQRGHITLWDIKTAQSVTVLRGHEGDVTCVQVRLLAFELIIIIISLLFFLFFFLLLLSIFLILFVS